MSRLRDLQVEWNSLVPAAQERGLSGVREVRLYPEGLHERIPHRQNRINWLRRELGLTTALSNAAVAAGVEGGFTFGVEIEFNHARTDRTQIAAALNAAGINTYVERWNHRVVGHWKLTTDNSLGSYATSSELVSPVLSGDDGFTQLTKACDVLQSLGCKVNKRCGLHVHIGVANESVEFFKTLVRLYNKATPVVESFLAPSRRPGGFACHMIGPMMVNEVRLAEATTMALVAEACGQDSGADSVRSFRRYRKLNLQSYWAYKTVEFRQHQGTVEATKACQWVRFCMRLCLAARKGAVLTDATMEALFATIGATEEETQFFMARRAFFVREEQRVAARLEARRSA